MRAPVHCVLFLAPGYGRLQRGRAHFFPTCLPPPAIPVAVAVPPMPVATPIPWRVLAAKQWAAAKPQALRNSPTPLELHRQELAPRRLAVLDKPGLHRPAVPCTPVGAPALRTHRQVPPNQRPVLRSRSPESYKPGPMRWPLKMPKRLRRERELYSSPISLVVLALHGRCARTSNED